MYAVGIHGAPANATTSRTTTVPLAAPSLSIESLIQVRGVDTRAPTAPTQRHWERGRV